MDLALNILQCVICHKTKQIKILKMLHGFLRSLSTWFHWSNRIPCNLGLFGHTFYMSQSSAALNLTFKAL